jgi:hypothetical protein
MERTRRSISIRRRIFFDVIDHQDGQRALVHLQLQPELLLERLEKGDGAGGLGCYADCARRRGWTRVAAPASAAAAGGGGLNGTLRSHAPSIPVASSTE